MRTLKFIGFYMLLAAATTSLFRPAEAQSDSVSDIKATAQSILTLQDQQKTITDNQARIDDKLATIAEDIRVARLFSARAR